MFNEKNKIYAIADQKTCNENDINVLEYVKILIDSGIKIIQYRNKINEKEQVRKLFEQIHKIIENQGVLIINDYGDIGKEFNCHVHIGQEDKLFDNMVRFGRSTHNILEVQRALGEIPAPEYIGFGGMYKSITKPEVESNLIVLDKVKNLWKKDIVLIGGITLENIAKLPRKSNLYYAIISDFFSNGSNKNEIMNKALKLSGLFQ
jgi:thiamine-phosphate pyrophosphorylase